MKRRSFMMTMGAVTLPVAAGKLRGRWKQPVKLGVIADLHQDVIHDADRRLAVFLKEMAKEKPDALVQLGDFAVPKKANAGVIAAFNKAHETALHVVGNHDTDGGFSKEQCLKMWGIEKSYYRKDVGGLRLLVLDGNEKGSPTYRGGYPSFIGKKQMAWLAKELEASDKQVVVLSHQPLAGRAAVDNAKEVQELLGKHHEKVVLAMNGHSHLDELLEVQGVSYLHVNSASYYWVGGKFRHETYGAEIVKARPHLNSTCPYRDPLFTVLTFDPVKGEISMTARKTEWVGASPKKLGVTKEDDEKSAITPQIRERKI